MNLSPRWVQFLADAGIDAEHWSKVGQAGASDAAIMEHARVNDLVVLTHDLDFSTILAASQSDGPSVVQIRSDNISPEAVGNAVIEALTRMSVELSEGALITIDPGRARLRVLPLSRT